MSDYTPETEEVRADYVYANPLGTDPTYDWDTNEPGAAFDRWLAEHDRQVASAEREKIVSEIQDRIGWTKEGHFGALHELGVLERVLHMLRRKEQA